jgi:DNA modification methylase
MPSQGAPYLDPQLQAEALKAFIAKYTRPYDEDTDDYDRLPFAADIKEGKNDPIYNAHSYHTKVPPRSIVPYILHYTQPGDLVLDMFCGSGMTGVAAQMCATPPADILESFPELRDSVGPRACVLNDLSPAACHIAYNYNTPVDIEAFKSEFERIKETTRGHFDRLYGAEHYEPAVGRYEATNGDVACRLKNRPSKGSLHTMFGDEERTWELLTMTEVEKRLGFSVTELPRDEKWKDLDLTTVKEWVCIPSSVQYTIWSDVYRCEGFAKIEELTGKISKRGKNAGKPIMRKQSVARGCGKDIVHWEVAVDPQTEEVSEDFKCPHCQQPWQKLSLELKETVPICSAYEFLNIRGKVQRVRRRFTSRELSFLSSLQITKDMRDFELDPKRELMTMGPNKRGVKRFADFFTPRNFIALNALLQSIQVTADIRTRGALFFAFTSIISYCCRKQNYGGGGGGMSGTLYIPSFHQEKNVWEVFERKVNKLFEAFTGVGQSGRCEIICNDARKLPLSDEIVDYIFVDPPFGGNIYYADASVLWEGWLNSFTDETKELVFNRQRYQDENFKTLDDYESGMHASFAEMFRVLKPGRWCTVEFNNSDGKVFEAIKRAVESAGFEIANMLLLDKTQKSFKQVKGASGDEDVVDKDVLFNLHKPSLLRTESLSEDHDLERQLADAVRDHLQSLPERIRTDPDKYNDEHRTTATINSMLMNTLIPRGVSVDRLNLPFIERVCARYFRKVGQRWYLRGESIGATNGHVLIEEEVSVKDELTAIAWLRQKIDQKAMLVGELKPLWMRATGLLPASVSQELSLDNLLSENFWRDADSNRWREPTDEEREKMNDDRSIRVLHDADRFIAGTLHRTTSDGERCEWIDVLFKACRQVEDGDMQSAPALRGFDVGEAYRVITRLFQSVLREKVSTDAYTRAQKQATVATNRIAQSVREAEELQMSERSRLKGPTLFDGVD